MEPYPVIVAGKKRVTAETVSVRFPYTGEEYARVCLAGEKDLDDAIASACSGFDVTKNLSSGARSLILMRLAGKIREPAGALTDILVMGGGETRKFAASEVARAEGTVLTAAKEAKMIGGEIIPLDWTEDTEGRTGYLQRFPIGPVAGILLFNFPRNLACHKLAPAIAAGNLQGTL